MRRSWWWDYCTSLLVVLSRRSITSWMMQSTTLAKIYETRAVRYWLCGELGESQQGNGKLLFSRMYCIFVTSTEAHSLRISSLSNIFTKNRLEIFGALVAQQTPTDTILRKAIICTWLIVLTRNVGQHKLGFFPLDQQVWLVVLPKLKEAVKVLLYTDLQH